MLNFTYTNESPGMVVVKCIGTNKFFLEKVIFPKEILIMKLPEGSNVEIWGLESYGPKLEQRIRVVASEDIKLAA